MTVNSDGASQILIEDLQARNAELKANNTDLTQRNAFLRQRPDLPVDRIPAYKAMEGRIDELEEKYRLTCHAWAEKGKKVDALQVVVDEMLAYVKNASSQLHKNNWNNAEIFLAQAIKYAQQHATGYTDNE